MGNLYSEHLKLDRLIDNDNKIFLGIVSPKFSNPLSTQAIKIGHNGKIFRLEKLLETNTFRKFWGLFFFFLKLPASSSSTSTA